MLICQWRIYVISTPHSKLWSCSFWWCTLLLLLMVHRMLWMSIFDLSDIYWAYWADDYTAAQHDVPCSQCEHSVYHHMDCTVATSTNAVFDRCICHGSVGEHKVIQVYPLCWLSHYLPHVQTGCYIFQGSVISVTVVVLSWQKLSLFAQSILCVIIIIILIGSNMYCTTWGSTDCYQLRENDDW